MTSISSRIVSTITESRNPAGKEENWINKNPGPMLFPSTKVQIKSEIGYALSTVIALVETAVSSVFVLLSLPLSVIDSRPLYKSIEWAESSSFTVIWSLAYMAFNLKAPNLLTREDLSKNFALRGDLNNYGSPWSSSLFMIAREMPSYLRTAYPLRFRDIPPENNIFSQMRGKMRRYKQLIGEVLMMGSGGNESNFNKNISRLDSDFKKINEELKSSKRPICAYFVSAKDSNGAILGDSVYYYHHYKIGKFKKHFDVSAKVVRTGKEMFDHLNMLKLNYENRPIRVVDIVAHGDHSHIWIPSGRDTAQHPDVYDIDDVEKGEFSGCGPEATLILDSCSTGKGKQSIAKKIAKMNPGLRVYAPGSALFFSKPTFKGKSDNVKIDHVTHGFALVNAYTARTFHKNDY